MSNARKAHLNERLDKIAAAINGTLGRNAAGYSIGGRSLQSLSLAELQKLERETLNELARLDRGSRFGRVGFSRVDS